MATRDEIWNAPFTQEHMQRATDYAVEATRQSMQAAFHSNIRGLNLDSPLEAAFIAWWCALARERSYEVEIHVQREVIVGDERFRLDFVVEPQWSDRDLFARAKQRHLVVPRIGIELDGHDFHERTKEQVKRRDSRDRALLTAGWTVLHFSGSEFHRDPVACIEASYSAAISAFAALKHRFWSAERDFPKSDSE
jgi:hypothetical protein